MSKGRRNREKRKTYTCSCCGGVFDDDLQEDVQGAFDSLEDHDIKWVDSGGVFKNAFDSKVNSKVDNTQVVKISKDKLISGLTKCKNDNVSLIKEYRNAHLYSEAESVLNCCTKFSVGYRANENGTADESDVLLLNANFCNDYYCAICNWWGSVNGRKNYVPALMKMFGPKLPGFNFDNIKIKYDELP